MADVDYKRAYERQKKAREKSDNMLENKARELYESNQSLVFAYNKLKEQKAKILHQEKLASVGELAAGIAHEINNPSAYVKSNLNSLSNYMVDIDGILERYETLLESCDGVDQSKLEDLNKFKEKIDFDFIREDLVDMIDDSMQGVSRIQDIVSSLLNFSRPDQVEPKYFDLNQCLEDTIKVAWNQIKYKASLDKDFGEIAHICGHKGSLAQVFLNILVNAAQAIVEHEGLIRVKTEQIDEQVHIKISDNGCGIAPENKNRLFDPFYSTKPQEQGTGLGLSISHGIVKKHGGQIDIESELGKGTTFTIILPLENCALRCEPPQT